MKAETKRCHNLEELESIIGVKFKNKRLLVQALTHRSYAYEFSSNAQQENIPLEDYERLEFLGDAVIDLVIGELLIKKFKNADEGTLSQFRARLVNIERLSHISKSLGLDRWLKLGKGEELTGGRKKPSILSSVYEAIVAAVYLDRGFYEAYKMINKHFHRLIENLTLEELSFDYKTRLQELIQQKHKKTPTYRIINERGPAHNKVFTAEIIFNQEILGRGTGKSKKEAEQDAARNAIEKLTKT